MDSTTNGFISEMWRVIGVGRACGHSPVYLDLLENCLSVLEAEIDRNWNLTKSSATRQLEEWLLINDRIKREVCIEHQAGIFIVTLCTQTPATSPEFQDFSISGTAGESDGMSIDDAIVNALSEVK